MFLLASAALAALPVTAPPPPASAYPDLRDRDVVTVLVLGDSGAAGFAPVALAAAKTCFDGGRIPCDLAVLVGDNVYNDGITQAGEQAWVDAFATPMAPFVARAKGPERFRAWAVAGNHDWRHEIDAEGEGRVAAAIATTGHSANEAIGSMWQFPALAYSVPGLPEWLNLHGIDTELIVSGKGQEVVSATRTAMQRTRGWDVVFGHHLPASSGGHGIDPEEDDDEEYARVLQTLRPAGLSLVLAGHDHHQELLESGGVPVVIQGNSSKGREVGPGKYGKCSRWVRGGKEARGFAIATFREEELTVEFFDAGGAVVHAATYRRDGTFGPRGRIGTCKAPVAGG